MGTDSGTAGAGGECAAERHTVLPLSAAGRPSSFIYLPVATALLLTGPVPWLARRAEEISLPIIGGLVSLLARIDRPVEVLVAAAVGAILGVLSAVALRAGAAEVVVTGHELRLEQDGRALSVARDEVTAVFVDGARLVIQDRQSRHVVVEVRRASATTLARVFRGHGYPWRDADPYADLYHRWEPGTPDLPPSVNDVLAAREQALRKRAGRDVRALRDAVQKVGYAVRDEGHRQYWRVLVRS